MDLWHRRRLIRLADSDEALPFGEPPLVLGRVIVTWEPIWRAAVASVLPHVSTDDLATWSWEAPLDPESASTLRSEIDLAIGELQRTGQLVVPLEVQDADWPDIAMVLKVLELLRMLLDLATKKHLGVETWTD